MKKKNKWKGSYSYQGLIQYWLNNDTSVDIGSTAEHRLSYRGNTLYSYSTVIAIKYEKYLWVTSNKYSNTTSRQLNVLLTENSKPVIYTPYAPKITVSEENYEYFNNVINKGINKVQRARKPNTIKVRKRELQRYLENYYTYIKYIDNVKPLSDKIIMLALITIK